MNTAPAAAQDRSTGDHLRLNEPLTISRQHERLQTHMHAALADYSPRHDTLTLICSACQSIGRSAHDFNLLLNRTTYTPARDALRLLPVVLVCSSCVRQLQADKSDIDAFRVQELVLNASLACIKAIVMYSRWSLGS